MTSATFRPTRTRSSATPDAICAEAADLAHAAAGEIGGDYVGDHQGCVAEGDRVVTHYFASSHPGYAGWRYAVTLVRASRRRAVTVNEVVMVPGPDALLAPAWVPWSERLRPGDLGVGDILPTQPEDDRLVPGYVDSGDPAIEDLAWELGLGRPRVMSRVGRTEAADRWHSGDRGPDTPIARQAPGRCGDCGFFLPLAGSLAHAFGACGNEFAPADGTVVSVDHGCGAHSEALTSTELPEPVSSGDSADTRVEGSVGATRVLAEEDAEPVVIR